ncbi:MAG: hypothetical protein PHP25_02270 [Candidatus Moranbacteria bacterium]|nr:hypothetical protein [Candidatus Moranbacteria bacterium]
MKNKLFFAVVVVFLFSVLNAEAAEKNSFNKLDGVLTANGFLRRPLSSLDNGFAEQKYFHSKVILVVNCLLDPGGELAGLAFEFQDDVPKGLLINFMGEILAYLGCSEDLDLLSNLITARREKGGFVFRCGDMVGSVAYADLLWLPLRRIEFSAK